MICQTTTSDTTSKADVGNQLNSGNSFSSPPEKLSQGSNFQEPPYSALQYQVHVLGEVGRPGTYRVTASSRISETLMKAGGISTNGSERNIQIRREGSNQTVDLLKFKMMGELNNNPYLMDNDVIFVPLKKKIVRVEGAVARPGSYEIKNERVLTDLIKLAGGYTPGYTLENDMPLKLIRYSSEGHKNIIEVNRQEASSFKIENADIYYVPHFLTKNKQFDFNTNALPGDNALFFPSFEGKVYIIGGVNSPGSYPFNPYYQIRNYITSAGGTNRLAKSKKIKVLSSEGELRRATPQLEINPGDTIIVPEKYLAPEGVVSIFLTTAATVLGITTTILTLKN